MDKQKCAIIGCGAVGATIAFALTQKSLFSELVLIDANKARAEGEAMDLSHGLPFAHPMKVYAGDYCDISDCFLIIITAGTAQRPNETRLDMVHKNVEIFKNIIPNITKYNNDAIILVVSNPVDILTYCSIDLEDFHGLCASCQDVSFREIYEDVRDSAYKVIDRKGATYYGIAMAVMRIVLSIIRDEHSVLPVSCYIDGNYGLNDLCIGVPAIVGNAGVEKVLDIPLSDDEKESLVASVKTLKSVIADLDI